MSRANQILVLVLIVQVALVGFVYLRPDDDDSREGGPLLANFNADDVQQIVLEDAEGNRLSLERTADTGWVLPAYDNYPARNTQVDGLLNTLADLRTSRLVTQTTDSHQRLGVADDDYRFKITLDEAVVYVGTTSGVGAVHARVNDEEQVYLVDNIPTTQRSTQLSSWVNLTYFSAPRDQMTAIRIQNGNGTFEFVKNDADEWTMAGLGEDEVFDATSLSSQISNLTSLRMIEPLGVEEAPEYGMDEPLATITVILSIPETVEEPSTDDESETEEPETTYRTEEHTVIIGAQMDDDYVVKSSKSEFFVKISSSTASIFIEISRDDFVERAPQTEIFGS